MTDEIRKGTHPTTNPIQFNPTDPIATPDSWLVWQAQPGDSLFFHYSGHGGSVRDRSGDEVDSKFAVCGEWLKPGGVARHRNARRPTFLNNIDLYINPRLLS